MKEYTLIVNFENNEILSDKKIELVQNDYNSTKFNFIFDKEYLSYDKTFELKYPNGEKLITKIENNIILLENVLIQSGEYQFEISLYNNDFKLTNNAIGTFFVRDKLVKNDDNEIKLETQYPILDQLINQIDNLDISANKNNNITTISITKKDGTIQVFEIIDGINGKDGKDGEQGPQGERGEPGAVKILFVNELPLENIETDAIYMKPSEDPDDENTYEEFVYANEKWEKLGFASVSINLDEYVKKEELNKINIKGLNPAVNTSNDTTPSIAIGSSANVGSSAFAVAIGTSSTGKYGTVSIGYNAKVGSMMSTAIGYNSNGGGVGYDGVSLGSNAKSGNRSMAIGTSATASIDDTIAIGGHSKAEYRYSIALGRGAQTKKSRQMVIGGSELPINEIILYESEEKTKTVATQDYVDSVVGNISSILATLTTVSEVAE